MKTNANAIRTLWGNSIFTNVALTDDGDVWWEGMTDEPPAHLIDWQGNDWTPESGELSSHPNSRFTAPAVAVPDHRGQLGGPRRGADRRDPVRRPSRHERAAGQRGPRLGARRLHRRHRLLRDDRGGRGHHRRSCAATPSRCCPFCGYNMADYWGHWLKVGAATTPDKLPKVYQVNWFRKGADGSFLWPGFGENSRVLAWIIDRVNGDGAGVETPIGIAPAPGRALPRRPRHRPRRSSPSCSRWTRDSWLAECDLTEEYFAQFGDAVPAELHAQLDALRARLQAARAS